MCGMVAYTTVITIEDGPFVGYRSVVTKDIAPFCVAAGSLAMVIKQNVSDQENPNKNY